VSYVFDPRVHGSPPPPAYPQGISTFRAPGFGAQAPSAAPGVIALLGGSFLGLLSLGIWLALGFHGFATALVAGLLGAASILLVGFAVARLTRKHVPLYARFGAAGAVAAIATVTGPSLSRSYQTSSEASLYAELNTPSTPSSAWTRYKDEVPSEFQRADWRCKMFEAEVREASGNVAKLRAAIADMAKEPNPELVRAAKESAQKQVAALYDEGKARLYAPPKTGSAPEFPVDDRLRAAFSQVLAELAASNDEHVYVAFHTTSDLTPPKGTDAALRDARGLKVVRASFPKLDAPVIDPGSAFSSERDLQRRSSFIAAMNESFSKVFERELITLGPLDEGASQAGKIVIEVHSKIARARDFFIYSNGEGAAKKVEGLAFATDVTWKFDVIDRDGKALYESPETTSQTAENLRIEPDDTDPPWALYSINTDSAYYNYSREIVGRFGFEPPPVKDTFRFMAVPPTPSADDH
jgi:hypothetical protein